MRTRFGVAWPVHFASGMHVLELHRNAASFQDAAVAIGIEGMGYHIPEHTVSVEELHASGRTTSTASQLRELGYAVVRVAQESAIAMAERAVQDLVSRSGASLDGVDMILFGGALATSSVLDPGADYGWEAARDALPMFRFPGTRLQAALGLPDAPVIGVSQLACNAMHGCLRLARAILLAEPGVRRILCVASDRFPTNAKREVVFNLMSDGACAALVSRGAARVRILAASQITRGTYWDGDARHDQLVAAYFPLARRVIEEALASAGLGVGDIDCFVPHNINEKSWRILSRILGLDYDRIYTANIARIGHVVAADNVINYLDAEREGRIRPGSKVALFVTGFGAHWSCTVVEA